MNSSVVKLHTQHVIYDPFSPFQIIENTVSSGTAFFFDTDLLLTCNHCVQDTIKTFISMPNINKKQFPVTILAIIPQLDIALLKLDKSDLKQNSYTVLPLGDSDEIKPLDQVIALGFPMDSDSLKFTKGIISGKQYEFLQTDASINPGNSGGPLLFKDRVIGINSHKIKNAENMGFSVPINFFKKWYEYISKKTMNGVVIIRLPSLNLIYSTLNENSINFLNKRHLDKINSGIMITQSKNSLIKVGDIITEINGSSVDNFGSIKFGDATISLNKFLINYIEGDKISISGIRDGKIFSIDILVKIEKSPGMNFVYTPFENYSYVIIGGILIMELTYNHLALLNEENIGENSKLFLKSESKLNKTFFVSRILNGSKIKSLDNIYAGNIILNVNKKEVSSYEELISVLKTPYDNHLILYLNNDTVFMYPYSELRKIDEELSKTYRYNIQY